MLKCASAAQIDKWRSQCVTREVHRMIYSECLQEWRELGDWTIMERKWTSFCKTGGFSAIKLKILSTLLMDQLIGFYRHPRILEDSQESFKWAFLFEKRFLRSNGLPSQKKLISGQFRVGSSSIHLKRFAWFEEIFISKLQMPYSGAENFSCFSFRE